MLQGWPFWCHNYVAQTPLAFIFEMSWMICFCPLLVVPATLLQKFQSLLNSGTSVCCFFFPLLVADIVYIKDIDVKIKWKGRFEKETWTYFLFNTAHQNSRPSRLMTADQSRWMEICSQPRVFRRMYSTRLVPAPQDSGRERSVTKF